MGRMNTDGKDIRRVLEWLLNRDVTDAEIATALDMPTSNYSRHKDDDDYPNFEELERIGTAFKVSPLVLQISFELRGPAEVMLFSEDEVDLFAQLGGFRHHERMRGAWLQLINDYLEESKLGEC